MIGLGASRAAPAGRWRARLWTVALCAGLAGTAGCHDIAAFFSGAPSDAQSPGRDLTVDRDLALDSDGPDDADLAIPDVVASEGLRPDASLCATKAAVLGTSFPVSAVTHSERQNIGFAIGVDTAGTSVQIAAFDSCAAVMKVLFTQTYAPQNLSSLRVDAALTWSTATSTMLCFSGRGVRISSSEPSFFVSCFDSTGKNLAMPASADFRFALTRSFLTTASGFVLGAAEGNAATMLVSYSASTRVFTSAKTSSRAAIGVSSDGNAAYVAFASTSPPQVAYRKLDAACLTNLATCGTNPVVVPVAGGLDNASFAAQGSLGTWVGTGAVDVIAAQSVNLAAGIPNAQALLNLDGRVDAATFAGRPRLLYLLGRRLGGTTYLAHLGPARNTVTNYTAKLGPSMFNAITARDDTALLLGRSTNGSGIVARCPLDNCDLSVVPMPFP